MMTKNLIPCLLFTIGYATGFQVSQNNVNNNSNVNANTNAITSISTSTSTTLNSIHTRAHTSSRTDETTFTSSTTSRRKLDCQHHLQGHQNRLSSTNLNYLPQDADFGESFAGGQRYEMVELPDSMVDTTIFVGNLCEFVTDEMLSTLFQQVSSLNYVPACVARKPNMSSMKYGFVTFPTISEKENAIIQFTGYELNDKVMKVEEITDYKYRVRVPEKLVVYAVGEVKRTREGKKNTMWKVSNSRMEDPSLKSTRMMMDRDRNSKSQQRRRRNKKTYSPTSSSMSSSFMFGSDRSDGDQYSYKCKKRKRKDNRRKRRSSNRSLDDYAF